jgi:hypothetical protein
MGVERRTIIISDGDEQGVHIAGGGDPLTSRASAKNRGEGAHEEGDGSHRSARMDRFYGEGKAGSPIKPPSAP